MTWYKAVITDRKPGLEGVVEFGPFGTRKEAQWAIEHEMDAARELFTDGDKHMTSEIVKA